VRSLGWGRILTPTRWTLRLSIRREIDRRIGIPALAAALDGGFRRLAGLQVERRLRDAQATTRDHSVAHDDHLPAEMDALWDRERARVELSLWKDARYLTWRYLRHPDHRFRIHTLRLGASLEGLAVSTIRDGTALICELMVPSRDAAAGRRLVGEMVAFHAAAGAKNVQFLGHDRGYLRDAFAGFSARPAPANVLVGRATANAALSARMADADRWTVAYGDGDFV
jgi:hypothetical protein